MYRQMREEFWKDTNDDTNDDKRQNTKKHTRRPSTERINDNQRRGLDGRRKSSVVDGIVIEPDWDCQLNAWQAAAQMIQCKLRQRAAVKTLHHLQESTAAATVIQVRLVTVNTHTVSFSYNATHTSSTSLTRQTTYLSLSLLVAVIAHHFVTIRFPPTITTRHACEAS